jgi:hypothetical protein
MSTDWRMNEIIRQQPEYSVPNIFLTGYTLKLKGKSLFKLILFSSLLTKPCRSPGV